MPLLQQRRPTPSKRAGRFDEIGGPNLQPLPLGLDEAGNTPFRRWKRETYRGGVSDPFIVSWPKGIAARGEMRSQYAHLIDMVPTVLDAIGIEPPASDRRRHPVADRGGEPGAHVRRRRGAEPAPDPVLRDARATARSTTTAGAPSARGRARRSRNRRASSATPSPPRCSPSSTRKAGSSTTSPRMSPRRRTWPTRSGTG